MEVVLVEKQDIVEKLANSVAWLKQAEDHMDQQTNVGYDFSQVQSQYLTHKVRMYICKCTKLIFLTHKLLCICVYRVNMVVIYMYVYDVCNVRFYFSGHFVISTLLYHLNQFTQLTTVKLVVIKSH